MSGEAAEEGRMSLRRGGDSGPRAAAGGGILLAVPPFLSITRPALGVSQLKAVAEGQGWPTEVLYPSLRFADRIGPDLYEWISASTTTILLGEFVFACLLFGHGDERIDRYLEEVVEKAERESEFPAFFRGGGKGRVLRGLVAAASDVLEECAEEIVSRDPWMLGITSVFQQNCASLVLARMVKRKRPGIVTVMGGANCQAVMGEELLSLFPEIDHVAQGEGDLSFVELIRSILEGGGGRGVAGILSRGALPGLRPPEPLRSEDLDRLPYPAFGDYFDQLATVSFRHRVVPGLVMETSRGCWWGAADTCRFCGLNGDAIGFRSKTPSRALEEMASLVERYEVPRIFLTDNVLDMRYFKSVIPKLAERPVAELFYETRTTLSEDQVGLLSRANVVLVQPGIESFSDRALQLMHKGTTGLQNIQFLKWCTEKGVGVAWNYLFGFPGEGSDEIPAIGRVVDLVSHLQPPWSVNSIHLDRFSPYFVSPEAYGLAPIHPAEAYRHVYPFPEDSLRRIAYFFESGPLAEKGEGLETLQKAVAAWRERYPRSHLLAVSGARRLVIVDTRECRRRRLHVLSGQLRRVYETCSRARSQAEVEIALGPGASGSEVASSLRLLVEARLMLEIGGKHLSLATGWSRTYRNFRGYFPGGALVAEAAKTGEGGSRGVLAAALERQVLRALLVAARLIAGKGPAAGERNA